MQDPLGKCACPPILFLVDSYHTRDTRESHQEHLLAHLNRFVAVLCRRNIPPTAWPLQRKPGRHPGAV